MSATPLPDQADVAYDASLEVFRAASREFTAVTKLEEALMWLNKRTADRQARAVEGKAAV